MSGKAGKIFWDLERFGLPPTDKFRRRLNPPKGAHAVFAVSMPKSGTHLLERALVLHPWFYRKLTGTVNQSKVDVKGVGGYLRRLKGGQFLMAHVHHSPEVAAAVKAEGMKLLIQVRDPRDALLSGIKFNLKRMKGQFAHDLAKMDSFEDQCRAFFHGNGAPGFVPLKERYEKYRPWLKESIVVVRFEDLVGEQGGGDRQAQLKLLSEMFEHLDAPWTDKLVEQIADGVFSDKSPTFSKGMIGTWKEKLPESMKDEFKQHAQEWLVEFGYETDDNW